MLHYAYLRVYQNTDHHFQHKTLRIIGYVAFVGENHSKWRLYDTITDNLLLKESSCTEIRMWKCGSMICFKEKSKFFKYAKWPSKWLTNESLVLRFNGEKKNEENFYVDFLIDFIFCRLAETAVSGSPSVMWLSRKWHQSGESVQLPSVSAVAILDCSLNVYTCGWQKALNHAGLLCCSKL